MRCCWATAIDSAFAIVTAPTTTATMPSASRIVFRIETNCFSPPRSKRSCARPLRTCADGPSSRASRARSAGADVPGAAAASTLSTRPRRSNSDWPVGRSNSAIVAVPSAFTSPKRTMPDTRKDRAGPPAAMRTVSPSPRPSRSAVAASIATAPAPAGQAPSSSRKADRRRAAASVNGKPTPKYGPEPETFPAAARDLDVVAQDLARGGGDARCRGDAADGRGRQRGTRGALDVAGCGRPAIGRRRRRRRRRRRMRESDDAACVIVPVRVMAPVTSATPSVTAMMLSSVRSRCARRSAKARRLMPSPPPSSR